MPRQLQTRAQVQDYLTEFLGSNQQCTIYETEHGWVCQPILTAEELASGGGLGLGNYVVNKQTGIVTAHRSLPPTVIGREFDEAIRTGQPVQGYQVYPPTWRVHIERIRETPAEIDYRVRAESLTQPPQPPADHQLTINKRSHRFHTDIPATHLTCRRAAAWAQARSQTGAWPETGTFEF
ncbi:hypothetical protein APR11_002372 [Nocardia amikacinitolerans]|nr:hypothetical protein [Nocardia amikacinitolerans]